MKSIGVELKMSTAYHPQIDGQTERVNQTQEQYLPMYCSYHDPLLFAKFTYNIATSESSKVFLFYANNGFEPSTDWPSPKRKFDKPDPASEILNSPWMTTWESIRKNLKVAQDH